MDVLRAVLLFVLAGLAEIGGGFLVWRWLRVDAALWVGLVGALVLVLYGIIPMLQEEERFGRVYAAYGGVFVVLSLLWGWWLDGQRPGTASTCSAPSWSPSASASFSLLHRPLDDPTAAENGFSLRLAAGAQIRGARFWAPDNGG